jgi:hypothetical protein
MSSLSVFFIGMIGALAPEVVRLYSIRTNPSRFRWSAFYIVISLLFACLGGIVALALPATTYWGALYAGVSTPVLVTTALKKTRKSLPPKSNDVLKSLKPERSTFRSFLEGL